MSSDLAPGGQLQGEMVPTRAKPLKYSITLAEEVSAQARRLYRGGERRCRIGEEGDEVREERERDDEGDADKRYK